MEEIKLTYKQRKNNYTKKWINEHKEHIQNYRKNYIEKYYDENRERILNQKREYYQRKKAEKQQKNNSDTETDSETTDIESN